MPSTISIGALVHDLGGGMLWWPAPTVKTAPQILVLGIVGIPLVYVPGTFNEALTTTVQWMKNGTVIAGATLAVYIPVLGDIGSQISIQETPANGMILGSPAVSNSVSVSL